MKKVFKLAALIVGCSGILFFISCEKDILTNEKNNIQNEKQLEFDISKFERQKNYEMYFPDKKEIVTLIGAFKRAVEAGDYTSMPSSMPLSEAIWTIEALLNAKTGHAVVN